MNRRNLMKDEDIFETDAIDFYDYDAMEKLHESRSKKYMKLVKKWMEAKKTGSEEAMSKAAKAISKHKSQDKKIKEKCCESGFYWY